MHFEAFGLTDRGQRRRRNEDAILYPPVVTHDRRGRPQYLLAVADGVGGAPAGQIASAAAISVLRELAPRLGEDPGGLMRSLFAVANAEVSRKASEGRGRRMATTLVAALVGPGQLCVGNVGDSRAYLVTGEDIRQLTRDHTWVAEQVEAGRLTKEQAGRSPQRNLITRSLGVEAADKVDVFGPQALAHGDTVILCSDGLYAIVSNDEIAECCRCLPPRDAATALVRLANERGAPDNVSVIVARVK